MKLLLDMNLSPLWIEFFERNGLVAVHWSTIGNPRATDREIMEWARANTYVVFTHDLDFRTILAVTRADNPSVIQSVHKMFFLSILVNLCLQRLNNFVHFWKPVHWLQLMKVHPARVFSRLTASPVMLRSSTYGFS